MGSALVCVRKAIKIVHLGSPDVRSNTTGVYTAYDGLSRDETSRTDRQSVQSMERRGYYNKQQ